MGIAGAASVLSIASAGFSAFGDITKSEGVAAADTYKAEQAERAAEYGELKATQTSGQMTRDLSMTLGNIDAVRAASHADPNSPTGAAVRDFVSQVGTEQKTIKVDSILAQAEEDTSNAAYLRSAASSALLSGDISAVADVTKGLGGLFSSSGLGNSSIGNPTKIGALY
jgi:hypothetical protein